jgi:hypothetical protein
MAASPSPPPLNRYKIFCLSNHQAPVYALSNQKLLSAGQRNKHSAFRTQPITLLFGTNQSLCFSQPTNHSAFQNQPITLLFRTNQSLCFSEPTNQSLRTQTKQTQCLVKWKHSTVWTNKKKCALWNRIKHSFLGTNQTLHSLDPSNTSLYGLIKHSNPGPIKHSSLDRFNSLPFGPSQHSTLCSKQSLRSLDTLTRWTNHSLDQSNTPLCGPLQSLDQ